MVREGLIAQDTYLILAFSDSEWTPEESEYLFKLAIEYDLRWYIIHDRYEYPGTARELEAGFHSIYSSVSPHFISGSQRSLL